MRAFAVVDRHVRARWSATFHAHLALCQLDVRAAVRADSVAKGIWPPKGGPDWLTGEMHSTIGLPTAISPLA
jgi:hypothetical protein